MKKLNNSGYTLVEIILAIAILGIAIVPILGYMTNSSGIITHADKREMALLIAQQRMEFIKSLGYEELSDNYVTDPPSYVEITDSDIGYPNYNDSKYDIGKIEEKIDDSTNGILDISIRVSWDNRETVLKSKLADR